MDIFYQTLGVSDNLLHFAASHSREFPFADTKAIHVLLEMGEEKRTGRIHDFYRAVGFASWSCFDSHQRPYGMVMDCNLNFQNYYGYRKTFDVVVNNGSTEHVFDQRAMFENIHNLCRVGGIMLHKIPTLDVLNIALYGCSPCFLIDLAQANNYDVLDLRLANRWGDMVRVRLPERDLEPEPDFVTAQQQRTGVNLEPIEYQDFTGKTPLPNKNFRLARAYETLLKLGQIRRPDNPGEIFVLALLGKKEESLFQTPFQGKYLQDIDNMEMKKRYKNQLKANGLL